MCAEDCTLVADLGLGELRGVGLDELVAAASALHRVDRKYLVPRDTVADVVAALRDSHHVLRIGDRLTTTYATTYFDTDDLATCRHHLQRRRRRWKVRSRLYREDQRVQLEVKTTSQRGQTLKTIGPAAGTGYGELGTEGTAFVDHTLGLQDFAAVGTTLRPTLEVTYERATLADLEGGTRLTIDSKVQSSNGHGRVWLDPSVLVVETKGHVRPSRADRVLVDAGARPRRFSKYVSAASLLHDDLRDNDVRRMLGHQLHVDRASGADR